MKMKKVLTCILALCMTLICTAAAAALDAVPDHVISENRDGRQLIIKTYTLPADADPAPLKEEPFEQEEFLYSLLSMTKEELPFEERMTASETVTVETATGDLADVLDALAPALPYDDGHYSGTLALDHTSLRTEATGYTTKSYTLTETKTIEGLDRNDPSYLPKTTVKNGVTLSLSNVEWSVQGTSLAGDTLVPTQFMAVATYSGSASSKVANGYLTTAEYSGEVTAAGIASITYTVTYLGEAIVSEAPPAEKGPVYLSLVLWGAGLLLAAALVLLLLTRKNASIYTLTEDGEQYERIGRVRLSGQKLHIDLRRLKTYPRAEAVIEIEGGTARRLFGRIIKIRLRDGIRSHLVEQSGKDNYWFTVTMEQEDVSE